MPRVATREIVEDLERQTKNLPSDGGYSYRLAGCYFNGSMARRNASKGLHFLGRAARLGHSDALKSIHNVYASCSQNLPNDLQESFNSMVDSELFTSIILLDIEFFDPSLKWKLDSSRQILESCARTTPRRIREAATSYGHEGRIIVALLGSRRLNNEESTRTATSIFFDFRSLPNLTGEGLPNFSQVDMIRFKADIARLRCLEHHNERGLTLLQEATAASDIRMTRLLVDQMGADIDNYGDTPGWTPLWIACFSGHATLAIYLLEKGALATCSDKHTGFTILHLLNRFRSGSKLARIMGLIIDNDTTFHVDRRCLRGLTPLYASFLGYDFSQGKAARILLEHGSDPILACSDSTGFRKPLDCCVERLDHVLLQHMLQASTVIGPGRLSVRRNEIAEAKAEAYLSLCAVTEFFLRSNVGEHWESAFEATLIQMIDDDMEEAFTQHRFTAEDLSLLGGAITRSRSHIAILLLKIGRASIDSLLEGEPALFGAIEKRMDDVALDLLARGADPLVKAGHGQNVLHHAARHNPPFLESLIDQIERMTAGCRQGLTMKKILDLPDPSGFTVVGLIIAEGTSIDLPIAERLRKRFELDLDGPALQEADTSATTLTKSLVILSQVTDMIPLSQTEYMLNLDPSPRFACSDTGCNLLHYAVAGWMSCELTSEVHDTPQADRAQTRPTWTSLVIKFSNSSWKSTEH